jgi:hypothetical protein
MEKLGESIPIKDARVSSASLLSISFEEHEIQSIFSVRRLVETTQLSFKVVEDDNKIVGFAAFDLEPDFESKNIKNDLFTAQSVLELMLFMAEEDHQNVDAIVSCVLTAVLKRKEFKR